METGFAKTHISLLTLLSSIITIFQACTSDSTKIKDEVLYPEGKRLSEIHCVTCHQHTTPEVLDRISWGKVLIQMKKEMDNSDIQLEEKDWLAIQQYYIQNAPNTLVQLTDKVPISKRALFEPSRRENFSKCIPFITSIDFDPVNKLIYIGDVRGHLMVFDQTQHLTTYQLNNIPIQAHYNTVDSRLEVLDMGSLMPSEAKTGQLVVIDKDGSAQILINGLQRPIHFLKVDIGLDDQYEYLISSFGSTEGKVNSGKLSLFVQDQGRYVEKVIKESPGATKSVVTDYNHDGLMDIVALFAQGREALYLFVNQGNHQFEERVIQEFDPVYGSNDFELVDINHDTYPDIIMTNGDNGDNSPIFKYYHGVRIFINDGNYRFKESFFYPLNGASKVICRDFDADEDMDFVLLSMYPDLIRWKNEVLVYFENKGNLSFIPQYLEDEPGGRWILIDAGDMDLDGDPDLIVGSNMRIKGILTPPRINEQWKQAQKSIQIFINQYN